MATEIEGIKEVTEAILGIGEVAIDNFTFKVSHSSEVVTSNIYTLVIFNLPLKL